MTYKKKCECSKPAVIKLNGKRICQRCYEFDRRKPKKEEKAAEWKMEYANDNLHYVDEACTRWLKKKGLWREKGFGRISYGVGQSGVQALLAKL